MGSLKPLLRFAGVTALERSIAMFRDADIDEVLVVLGNRAEELRHIAQGCGARCVENARFEQGMYSSVVAGVQALPQWVRGAFMLPADVPLVRSETVRQLAAVFAGGRHGIIYPVFEYRRGHPPLIARSILNQAGDGAPGPLCALLTAHEESALDVPVDDEAIHLDMDTPGDFDALRNFAARYDVPTTCECEAMLARYQVPKAVVRHSRKVAEVAGQIADALSAAGLDIKPELARAGGLLHDLAKGQPNHAEAGAAILRDLGMPSAANVVAAHTDLEFTGTIDERVIVYLADKLTSGDRLCTLDDRFRRALNRFRDHADALQAAHRRKAVAKRIAAAVEARLGTPLSAILSSGEGSSLDGPMAPGSEGVHGL
jgi:probable phosphoglycerate mutase